MSPKRILRLKTVDEAQAALEVAVRNFVKQVEWANPYSIAGRRYMAKINELRIPLLELKIAKKTAGKKC